MIQVGGGGLVGEHNGLEDTDLICAIWKTGWIRIYLGSFSLTADELMILSTTNQQHHLQEKGLHPSQTVLEDCVTAQLCLSHFTGSFKCSQHRI